MVTYSDLGTHRKKYFKRKVDAEDFVEARKTESEETGTQTLTPAEKNAVLKYRDRLARVDGDVEAALRSFVEARERANETVPVEEAIESLIATKKREGKSERYLRDLRNRLDRFALDFGSAPISSLATGQLDDWLYGLGVAPTTQNNFRRILGVLWTFASKKGWCDDSVAKDCESSKAVESDVGILTPRETASLLHACDDQTIPAVAIGAFAGLRRAEIERLDWAEVDLKGGHVEVKATKAKSARRRLVAISDNLKTWLSPHSKLAGRVVPPNFKDRLIDARKAAGIHDWPANALRHSYASYHLAHHHDAAKLALELGHTNSALIFAHYRELVRPSDAAAYWAIAACALEERVIAM